MRQRNVVGDWAAVVIGFLLPFLFIAIILLISLARAEALCLWNCPTPTHGAIRTPGITPQPTPAPTGSVLWWCQAWPALCPKPTATARPLATPTLAAGDCCRAHATGGCSNLSCSGSVRSLYPTCGVAWTPDCVLAASNSPYCKCPPVPTTTPRPELFSELCAHATPLQQLPLEYLEYQDVLRCLNSHAPTPTGTPAPAPHFDDNSARIAIAYLPTQLCPSSGQLCCTNLGNNYCPESCCNAPACDGLRPCASDPSRMCRIAGLTIFSECGPGKIVLAYANDCTDATGTPIPDRRKALWRWEMINSATGGRHDLDGSWWGWRCD